jgi:hypothetical protein
MFQYIRAAFHAPIAAGQFLTRQPSFIICFRNKNRSNPDNGIKEILIGPIWSICVQMPPRADLFTDLGRNILNHFISIRTAIKQINQLLEDRNVNMFTGYIDAHFHQTFQIVDQEDAKSGIRG